MSVEELKELQDKIINKNKKCNIIGITIMLIIIISTIFFILTGSFRYKFFVIFAVFFEIIIGLIVIAIIKNGINGKNIEIFNKEYKNIFVLKSLNNVFDDLKYNPKEGLKESVIEHTGMMDMGDRFTSNDYISGKYKNIEFEQSDIEIQEKQEEKDDDGHTRTTWETIFSGRWMIFDFNKKFKANLQVSSLNFIADSLPSIKEYKSVKMEDVEFNKKFSVFTNLEHDAFYILTPHFMENIKNISEKLNCGIMFCFIDNKLHVAIDNSTDSFEYNVLKKIDEQEINNNIIKDIQLITSFVDELNLDNDLFKEDK